jgi:hypothetical protein
MAPNLKEDEQPPQFINELIQNLEEVQRFINDFDDDSSQSSEGRNEGHFERFKHALYEYLKNGTHNQILQSTLNRGYEILVNIAAGINRHFQYNEIYVNNIYLTFNLPIGANLRYTQIRHIWPRVQFLRAAFSTYCEQDFINDNDVAENIIKLTNYFYENYYL